MVAPFVSYLYFSVNRRMHRQKMWEMTERKNFHTLLLKADEIFWVKKGREILVNDTYFDIKKIEIKNGWAMVTGIFDHEEKTLAARFEREQESKNDDPAGMAKLKTWWQLAYSHSCGSSIHTSCIIQLKKYPELTASKSCGQRQKPIPPPPNMV